MKKSNLVVHSAIMTAVNLIMRSIGVWFNSYLTDKIGSSGIGLFQLVMTVYSLAVTFSCAGIKLATTRISVEIKTLKNNDLKKSLSLCITYAGICGTIIGFILFIFSDYIGLYWIENPSTAFPLKILSLSLPFVAMSSAMSGYFTAVEYIPHYSAVQMLEQGFKIAVVIYLIDKINYSDPAYACISIVIGMTSSEIFSFVLASILKKIKTSFDNVKTSIKITEFLRIAIPDAVGTCARSVLLTIEHLLIPKGFKKSGSDSTAALASYGNIHAMAMPVLLYPSAILSSVSALLVPRLAEYYEINDRQRINHTVARNLKRTLIYSLFCSVFFYTFASELSELIYKSKEAAKYMRILSPLVPVMYTDMITDGMLKGLDQQVYSMRYNIIDSALCVGLVYLLLPKYSINGYILILYISEILNFILSIGRLYRICDIELRYFQAHGARISMFSLLKKCLNVPSEYEYQTYRVREKRSQDL